MVDIKTPDSRSCGGSLRMVLDESASINDANWQKQVVATADAIRDPGIVRLLIKSGGTALGVDSFDNAVSERIGWTIIRSQEDANALANKLYAIGAQEGRSKGDTNIGRALHFALDQLKSSPCPGNGVIDISTDADNNGDTDPRGYMDTFAAQSLLLSARKRAEREGWVINGIGVDGLRNKGENVRRMLEADVITKHTGGFAVGTSWDEYAPVLRDKLSREIAQVKQGHEQLPVQYAGSLVPTPTPHVHDGTAQTRK